MSRKSNFQDLFAKSYHICKLVLVALQRKRDYNEIYKSNQKSRAKIYIKKTLSFINVWESSFITVSPNRLCFPRLVLQNAHSTEFLHYPMSRSNLPSIVLVVPYQNKMCSSHSQSFAHSRSSTWMKSREGVWRSAGVHKAVHIYTYGRVACLMA